MSSAQLQSRRVASQFPRHLLLMALTLAHATLFAVTPTASAQTFSLLYQFKAGPDGSNPYASLILDGQGNLYGTTTIDGAYGYGTVFKVTPTGNEKVLHSFTGTAGDGANPFAPLVRDSAGNLYGTTSAGGLYGGACGAFGCGTIFKIDPAGTETVLYSFAGNPDGLSPEQGLVRDSSGNLYGTTFQGGRYGGGIVFKIDPAGMETVIHNFNLNGIDGNNPFGGCLLRDPQGNLYGTTEFGGLLGVGTVFKLAPGGKETILHSFELGVTTDGYIPYGTLAVDPAGNLYGVTNYGGAFLQYGAVFKIDASNQETLLYSFSGIAGDGAVPAGGLVRDSAGNLYGATNSGGDSYFGTVFKLDPSGTEAILHTFSGVDGRLPDSGLVRDSAGNFYGTTQYGGAYGGGVVFKITP